MTRMSWKKLKHLENEKKLLRRNKKHFLSFLKGFSVGDVQISLKQILCFLEFWSFQCKNISMIPVKASLDYKVHFFLTELLQKYNLYLLIMNVKDIQVKFWQSVIHHYDLVLWIYHLLTEYIDFLNFFSGSIATSCELQINELLVHHIAS